MNTRYGKFNAFSLFGRYFPSHLVQYPKCLCPQKVIHVRVFLESPSSHAILVRFKFKTLKSGMLSITVTWDKKSVLIDSRVYGREK